MSAFPSTPAEVRTLDTLIKSQVLYQLSYGCIVFLFSGCKGSHFFSYPQILRLLFFLMTTFLSKVGKDGLTTVPTVPPPFFT